MSGVTWEQNFLIFMHQQNSTSSTYHKVLLPTKIKRGYQSILFCLNFLTRNLILSMQCLPDLSAPKLVLLVFSSLALKKHYSFHEMLVTPSRGFDASKPCCSSLQWNIVWQTVLKMLVFSAFISCPSEKQVLSIPVQKKQSDN